MENNNQKVGAVIVAAGESRRMGGVDKMHARLGGEPLLRWSLAAFQQCSLVDRIVLVVNEKNLEWSRKLAADEEFAKVTDVCPGGERRQDSVTAGLARLDGCDWVIVHDGARPLVTVDLIERGLEAARETGIAVAAVPVTDTIKAAGEDGIVLQTLSRQNLWAVQTPQVFRSEIIKKAYQQADSDVTDDASLAEQLGYKVRLYHGSYDNIKITNPDDLISAEALWQKREH